MNMNLFAMDLKRNFKRFIIWTISIVLINVFTMAMYQSIAGEAESIARFVEMYPEGLMKAFGMDSTTWTNVLGFYTTYFIFYVLEKFRQYPIQPQDIVLCFQT